MIVGVLAVLTYGPAGADPVTLVDTGSPPPENTGYALAGSGSTELWQWVAAQFTVPQSARISEISGWIGTQVAGDLRIALYRGGDLRPAGAPLHGTVVSRVDAGRESRWVGATISWNVKP